MLFGIDLGGTKIEGVVLDADLSVRARRRIDTEQDGGYEHILQRVVDLTRGLESECGVRAEALGIGTPGTLDESAHLLRGSNTQCLNGRAIQRDLEARLGAPVRIENDANCFALAEFELGAARGARLAFGVILGTGVGGGIVVDGRIWKGPNGLAGEWGHNVLEPDGVACYCGKRGCVETILSGPGLLRHFNERSGRDESRLESVMELAAQGNALAEQTVERLLRWFGVGMAMVVNVLDPDVIVLGGGVSNVSALYSEGVKRVRSSAFHPAASVTIRRNALGDSAGVFGAALLGRA